MRDMLEPIFGESGAIVAQFVLTLVAVLVLIGLLYWLVQRFSGIRLAGAARARVPRLAVIDALSIDGRRKLVLVRRDNVEHLILIGGTSDLVVEPSIMRGAPAGARQRQAQAPRPQPQAQPQPQPQPQPAAAAAPQPAPQPQAAPQRPPAEANGISEPIPFPQTPTPRPQPRATPRAAEPPAAPSAAPERPAPPTPEPVPQRRAAVRAVPAAAPAVAATAAAGRAATASAHFEEPARPSRIESVFSLADALDEIADEPISTGPSAGFAGPKAQEAPRRFEEAVAVPAEADEEPVGEEPIGEEPAGEAIDISPEPAPAIATDDASAEAETPQQEDEAASATKVSDLEREMARLLGEITSRRDS